MVLRTIDPGIGPENPEEVIRHSLEKYARPVDVSRIIPSEEETVGVEEYPELTPAMWLVLMQFRVKGEMEKSEVISAMKQEWGASVTVTQDALHALALKNYVLVRKQVERRHKRVTTAEGKKKDVYYKNIRYYYSISPLAVRRFFSDIPVSPRAGGDEHLAMMAHLIYDLRLAGNFVFLDLGKDGEKKKPDILVFPLEKKARDKSQEINFKMWDTPHVYAIEVETKPLEYKERLLGNWRKCKNMGIPVIFAVKDYEKALNYLLKHIELYPEDVPINPGAYLNIAYCYLAMKDFANALMYLDIAIEKNPEYTQVFELKANIFMQTV